MIFQEIKIVYENYQTRLISIERIYICKTLRGNLVPNKISQRCKISLYHKVCACTHTQ